MVKLQYGVTCQDILLDVVHTFVMNVFIVGVTVIIDIWILKTHYLTHLKDKRVLIGNGLRKVVFGSVLTIKVENGHVPNMIGRLMVMKEKIIHI